MTPFLKVTAPGFRKVVTHCRPFRRIASTVAAVVDRDLNRFTAVPLDPPGVLIKGVSTFLKSGGAGEGRLYVANARPSLVECEIFSF